MFQAVVGLMTALCASAAPDQPPYQHEETRALVSVVEDAATLVGSLGEASFPQLREEGSRWRRGEAYVFVLDPKGQMMVHPDPALEGKNQLRLKDINGKPIIRGLIDAALADPAEPDGWYHYEWPVPGALLPRWKSSYVRKVTDPAGKTWVVGSGIYDDRMERGFVVDLVRDAVALLEKSGEASFPRLRDPADRFMAKDAYLFVIDQAGVELVNPAFPNLEGRSVLDVRDTDGKAFVRELISVGKTRGSGWVDYQWPKPGESASSLKSTYVSKAQVGGKTYLVACGVYLEDAPKQRPQASKLTPKQVMTLVDQAATLLGRQGEKAFPQFRAKGSKWFHDETYLFVWSMDGVRRLNAANPTIEGADVSDLKDVRGRPMGKMLLETASTAKRGGWVHYQYPEPGKLFPIWKSSYVKKVVFPDGKEHLVGCGIYDLQLDETFIEDVVDRAAALIEERGPEAFATLRDRNGPFYFIDTYVFVDRPDGTEVVNPGHPSLEGKNLWDLRDVKGKYAARDYIQAALQKGRAWSAYHWYRPGENRPALKRSYVRKVESGTDTFIVGSGFFAPEPRATGRRSP